MQVGYYSYVAPTWQFPRYAITHFENSKQLLDSGETGTQNPGFDQVLKIILMLLRNEQKAKVEQGSFFKVKLTDGAMYIININNQVRNQMW